MALWIQHASPASCGFASLFAFALWSVLDGLLAEGNCKQTRNCPQVRELESLKSRCMATKVQVLETLLQPVQLQAYVREGKKKTDAVDSFVEKALSARPCW